MKQAFFAALLLSGALSTSAMAKPIPAGGLTTDDVVAWLQNAGYTAHLDVCHTGGCIRDFVPVIISYADHHEFLIYLHDCKDGRCTALQFTAGTGTGPGWAQPPTPALLAQWNSSTGPGPKIVKWLPGPGAMAPPGHGSLNLIPALDFKLALSPGATYEQLDGRLATWHTSLDKFYDFMRTGALKSG
jgi:hypothetical protein